MFDFQLKPAYSVGWWAGSFNTLIVIALRSINYPAYRSETQLLMIFVIVAALAALLWIARQPLRESARAYRQRAYTGGYIEGLAGHCIPLLLMSLLGVETLSFYVVALLIVVTCLGLYALWAWIVEDGDYPH